MVNSIVQFIREEEGITTVEYGLMAALMAAVIFGAVTMLGTTISNAFLNLSDSMSAAGS